MFNDYVQPIALPKQMQVTPVGSLAVVSGWGATVVRITLEFDVVYFYSSSSSFPYGCRRHSTRSRLNIDFLPSSLSFSSSILKLLSSSSLFFFFAFFRRR